MILATDWFVRETKTNTGIVYEVKRSTYEQGRASRAKFVVDSVYKDAIRAEKRARELNRKEGRRK